MTFLLLVVGSSPRWLNVIKPYQVSDYAGGSSGYMDDLFIGAAATQINELENIGANIFEALATGMAAVEHESSEITGPDADTAALNTAMDATPDEFDAMALSNELSLLDTSGTEGIVIDSNLINAVLGGTRDEAAATPRD